MTKDEILIGIDYGERNIGLAFGREGQVMPITTIQGKNTETAIVEINRYVLENKAKKLILGLPLNSEGKETLQSKKVRRFGNLLKIRLKKPIEYENEYLTSMDADQIMLEDNISSRNKKKNDQYAAALILKRYYSEREA